MPDIAQDGRNRLRLTDSGADALFADALEELRTAATYRAVTSIPVAASNVMPPVIVHLLPIRGAAHDFFLNGSAIMIVTPVDKGLVPNAEVLQGLFDLSPAEARVARGFAAAHTIDTVAEAIGVSRETVRTQLKAVLAKTGVARQAELVSLLAGKALPKEND